MKLPRTILTTLLLAFAGTPAFANDPAPGQDRAMCEYAANHMIELAKQSLEEKSSRPERVEKRRKLVEDWTSRLENGEDPCSVYADIQQAATTF